MTAIRFIEAPTRRPDESGKAFIDRMLAELDAKKGAAPPRVHVEPVKVEIAKAKRKAPPFGREWIESQAKALEQAKPAVDEKVVDVTHGPFPVKELRGPITAGDAPLDWRGRPDLRPTTKSWPPGPIGPDGRSTHRYVGKWPPKWASKWTTNPKKD